MERYGGTVARAGPLVIGYPICCRGAPLLPVAEGSASGPCWLRAVDTRLGVVVGAFPCSAQKGAESGRVSAEDGGNGGKPATGKAVVSSKTIGSSSGEELL